MLPEDTSLGHRIGWHPEAGVPHWAQVYSALLASDLEPLAAYVAHNRHVASPALRKLITRLCAAEPSETGLLLYEGRQPVTRGTARLLASSDKLQGPDLASLLYLFFAPFRSRRLVVRKHPKLSRAKLGPIERVAAAKNEFRVAKFMADRGAHKRSFLQNAVADAQVEFGIGSTKARAIWHRWKDPLRTRQAALEALRRSPK